MSINTFTLRHWKSKKHQRVPPLEMKKNFVSYFDEIQKCNPYALRISYTKFEWNQRQKFFPDSKGGPFDDFLKIRKIPKGPPFGKKIFFCLRFYSNFMCEILRPLGFQILSFIIKKKILIFFPFSPNARGPPKIFDVRFFKFFGKKCQK